MKKFLAPILAIFLALSGVAYAGFPGGWQSSSNFDQDGDGRVDTTYGGTDISSAALSGIPTIDNGAWTAIAWGTAGYVLKMNGTGDGVEWGEAGAGSGDVTGPASSVDGDIVLFNGATGKIIKSSGYSITSAGADLLDDADVAAQRATLGLGTMATQAATAVNIDGGSADNVVIGAGTAAAGTFTALTSTGTATHSAGEVLPDDQGAAFGTGSDYLCQFISASSIFRCSTNDNGATLTDTDGMYTFQVNGANGTLDPGQRVFQLLDYLTSLMYVDAEGDLVIIGEFTGAGFNSSASDGYHYGNLLNTNGYSYTPAGGDFHWDNTLKAWSVYDDGISGDVITGKMTKTFPLVIQNPGESHDFPFWQTGKKIVITGVSAVCTGGTNVIGALDEYNATGTSVDAVVDSDWTITTSEFTDTSFTNADIDAGDWVGFHVTSVSGTVNFLSITVDYYETY